MRLYQKLIFFLAFFIPFSFALSPKPTIDLNILKIAIPLLFITWFLECLANKKIVLDQRPRFFFLSTFLLLILTAFLKSEEKTIALRRLLFFLSLLPLYFPLYQAQKNKLFVSRLLSFLFFGAVLESIIALLIFTTQFFLPLNSLLTFLQEKWAPIFLGHSLANLVSQYSSWLVNISGHTVLRSFGTFPDPHLFSLYLAMILPLGLYLQKKNSSANLFSSLYFWGNLIIMAGVLTSFSRGAYLALFSGLFFLFLFSQPLKIVKKYFTVSLVIIILLFLTTLIPNPLTARLKSSFDFQEGSNSGRMAMWQKALTEIKKHPYSGLGLGGFAIQINDSLGLRNPAYAHNLFLDFSAETGLINGLVVVLLIFSPIFHFIFRRLQSRHKFSNHSLTKYLATSFLIFFVHSLFETPFYSVRVFPLFLILLSLEATKKQKK